MKPIAIDPPFCGCTECMTGEYVPLNEATAEQMADMLAGKIRNNTGMQLQVSFVFTVEDDQDIREAELAKIQVIGEGRITYAEDITSPEAMWLLQRRLSDTIKNQRGLRAMGPRL